MVYVSYDDLNRCIKNNLNKLPDDIDLVVANPRSGIIPATIISLIKNISVCDMNVFETNNIYECGLTKNIKKINSLEEARKILIVEDSSYSGTSLKKIRNAIPDNLKNKCLILTIYVNNNTASLTDLYFENINKSRIFEWNLFHHRYLNYAAIELDVIYNNALIIKPTQTVKSIIIEDNISKEIVKDLLSEIDYEKIIYKNELTNEDLIICKDKEMYNNTDAFIIEY